MQHQPQLEKVQPKKVNFDWYQDNKYIKVRLPIAGTSSKKIDVFISDLILKVNAQEKSYVHIFDLEREIDFTSKETRFVYSNGVLEVNLVKQQQGLEWDDLLVQGLSKEEIKQRREESFKREEETHKNFLKTRQELKYKYDSLQTKEQMNQEDRQRRMLDDKKNQIRAEEEERLFGEAQTKEQRDLKKKQEQKKTKEYIYKDNSGFDDDTKFIRTYKGQYANVNRVSNDIFSDKDLEEYEAEIKKTVGEIPKPRQTTKVGVNMTEKLYPGISVREQHFKDAPLPKSMKNKLQQSGSEIDMKNPLWLKDKGDSFFKNQDYFSAATAYATAFKIDNQFLECLSNKIACNMHLFAYDEVVEDCEQIIENLSKIEDEEKKEKYFMLGIKTRLRLAIALSWQGNVEQSQKQFDELKTFCEQEENKSKIPENVIQSIEKSEKNLQIRVESIKIKKQGDLEYANAQYEKSLDIYKKALEVENNETVLGNISVTLLKLKRQEECIQYCDECLKRIEPFIQNISFNSQYKSLGKDNINNFLIKLYLRKSKAQLEVGQIQEGFQTVKKAIQIDEQNKEARQIYNQLEKEFNLQKVMNLKQEAAGLMKEQKIKEALEIYNECLKILDPKEIIEYLALLLNRCACYLFLKMYEEIITSSIRGIKIIRSQKSRVLSWDSKTSGKEFQEKLNNFEVRFLVRRSNAYLQQNLIYNAKTDLNEALKLDPNNQQLQQDLQKLENSQNSKK